MNASAAVALVLVLCAASVSAQSSTLTAAQVGVIRKMVAQQISSLTALDAFNNSYHPLIPGFVRLAFHACVGVSCGGCLNINMEANNGLNISIQALEQVLADMKDVSQLKGAAITRADLWALAAAVAFKNATARLGATLAGGPEMAVVFGRQDCPTAPYTSDTPAYPDRRWSIDAVLSFFAGLGFSAGETVALMGTHSLGVVRDLGTAAVKAQWDQSPDAAGVNFYQFLVDPTRRWSQVPLSYTALNYSIYSFRRNTPGPNIMLNSDVALVANLSIVDSLTGQSSCSFTQCQPSATAAIVNSYAQNGSLWLADVVGALNKLTARGYGSALYPAV